MSQTPSTTPRRAAGGKSTGLGSPADLDPIRAQLRELYGRTVYSQKTHIIQAGLELTKKRRLKIAEIALSATSTTGLVFALLGTGYWALAVSAIASSLLLGLIFYTKDYDLGQIAEQHKRTSDELWHLREKYLDLLTDLEGGACSGENIMKRRDALREDLNAVYAAAPVTSCKAYEQAQNALKNKEDLTFSDDEIDAFLPTELKNRGRPARRKSEALPVEPDTAAEVAE